MSHYPKWYYPQPDLEIDLRGGHELAIGQGAYEDQAGLVFVHVTDESDEAIVAVDVEQATAIRDYLDGWLAWANEYLSSRKQEAA